MFHLIAYRIESVVSEFRWKITFLRSTYDLSFMCGVSTSLMMFYLLLPFLIIFLYIFMPSYSLKRLREMNEMRANRTLRFISIWPLHKIFSNFSSLKSQLNFYLNEYYFTFFTQSLTVNIFFCYTSDISYIAFFLSLFYEKLETT